MKRNFINLVFFAVLLIAFAFTAFYSCRSTRETGKNNTAAVEMISSNISGSGASLGISFLKGKSFNHPTFAIWIEDTTGIVQSSYIRHLDRRYHR